MQWGPTSFSERNGARTTAQWGNDDGHECDAERHDKYDAEGKGINGMSAEHQEQDEVEIMYEKVDYAKRKEFNDARKRREREEREAAQHVERRRLDYEHAKKEKDKQRTANDKITSALSKRSAVVLRSPEELRRAAVDGHASPSVSLPVQMCGDTVWTWCPALGWLPEDELQRQIDELNHWSMLAIDGDDATKDKGLDTEGDDAKDKGKDIDGDANTGASQRRKRKGTDTEGDASTRTGKDTIEGDASNGNAKVKKKKKKPDSDTVLDPNPSKSKGKSNRMKGDAIKGKGKENSEGAANKGKDKDNIEGAANTGKGKDHIEGADANKGKGKDNIEGADANKGKGKDNIEEADANKGKGKDILQADYGLPEFEGEDLPLSERHGVAFEIIRRVRL